MLGREHKNKRAREYTHIHTNSTDKGATVVYRDSTVASAFRVVWLALVLLRSLRKMRLLVGGVMGARARR